MQLLPFDIIHTLLEFTPIIDLVHLCSTCKSLRAHLKNDSVWRRECLSYGVRDLTYFGGQSAYSVFARLLHPYGPLIGLWANDAPFYGKILEFRLFNGNETEQGGIIGEVWTSPSMAPADSPAPPTYVRAVKLSFESDTDTDADANTDSDSPDPSPGVQDATGIVNIFCDQGTSPPSRHRSSIVRLSATNLGKFLQFYRRKVNLPDFPPHISPWYDTHRALPHTPELPETTAHHRELIKLFPAARLPAVFVAPTAVLKPAAISIRCARPAAQCACFALHATALPFANLDARTPRYYPLKSAIIHGADPAADAWSVAALDGIWYGSYGPNGTECIYLAHDEDLETVEATKITGDVHVPRGCVSWIVHIPLESQRETLQGYWAAVRADDVVPRRVLMGHGTIAGRGFTDMAIVELMAGVISEDQIDIFWTEIHEFRTYKRYKGRPSTL
ncbi:uncharacterized protein TRAVEDRAFT_112541 [Trametes versicolor FP-101664 SS1]|uniref:uncharacterized protein n=1 Tax=Trametes versicolor (strain FP-101664) TaxID=717944 RepID=UPI00046212E5|nr:uncharacterized protein TRAVEDRAFT_112541 [Trametes versicolor FP-101664 SS1]EIW62655.1 hypothetical protein TRAVEDRAFT_112541 [Trametes versicolor FP-101664 SS1]